MQTNVNALVAQQNLRVNSAFQAQTIQRLTSGYRVNSASDDAAGLAVASSLRSNITELSQGVRNGSDAVSQLQIADGGATNISRMLDRMSTLATEAAGASFTGDRAKLNDEFQSLTQEIDRQASSVGLAADPAGQGGGRLAKNLQVYAGGGAAADASVSVNLAGHEIDARSLGLEFKDGEERGVAGAVADHELLVRRVADPRRQCRAAGR